MDVIDYLLPEPHFGACGTCMQDCEVRQANGRQWSWGLSPSYFHSGLLINQTRFTRIELRITNWNLFLLINEESVSLWRWPRWAYQIQANFLSQSMVWGLEEKLRLRITTESEFWTSYSPARCIPSTTTFRESTTAAKMRWDSVGLLDCFSCEG